LSAFPSPGFFLICTPYIGVKSDANIAVDTAALMDVSATSKSRKSVIANCQAPIVRMDSNQPDIDFVPVVKFFTSDAQCTWLLTELGLDDIAFGLADLGMGCPELGFISMREIRELRGPLGLPVERDLHFDADKTLSAYAHEARAHGRIVT
jgi:DUF2958 family protein